MLTLESDFLGGYVGINYIEDCICYKMDWKEVQTVTLLKLNGFNLKILLWSYHLHTKL